MHIIRTSLLISALVLQTPSAREPATELPQPELSISVDVDLVNVLFTVLDRKGRFVSSLSQEKFQVFDDNKPQVITHFSRETDLPLSIAVLMDISGSVREKIGFERAAAIAFLRSTIRNGTDQATLIAFDVRPYILHEYTDDIEALARASRHINAGGGTSLYRAVHWAASEKLAGQTGRRIEILISDGIDTTSHTSLDEALKAVQQSDTTIYCISTNSILKNSSQDAEKGNRVLRQLAEETGGRLFLPAKVEDLPKAFKTLNEELRAQYTLAYRPSETEWDGAFHRIRVETHDRQLFVRTRLGYFARKN
jgi:VWFA-related protein